MTRRKPFTPSEFAELVADYSRDEIDAGHVRISYEAQIVGVRHGGHDPLNPSEFVASLVVNAGVNVSEPDRDCLQEIYAEQINTAEELAGDSRV